MSYQKLPLDFTGIHLKHPPSNSFRIFSITSTIFPPFSFEIFHSKTSKKTQIMRRFFVFSNNATKSITINSQYEQPHRDIICNFNFIVYTR